MTKESAMKRDPRYTTVQAIHDLRKSFSPVTARLRKAEQVIFVGGVTMVRFKGGRWWTDAFRSARVRENRLALLAGTFGYHCTARYYVGLAVLNGLVKLGLLSQADAQQFQDEAKVYDDASDRRYARSDINRAATRLGIKLSKSVISQIDKAVAAKCQPPKAAAERPSKAVRAKT